MKAERRSERLTLSLSPALKAHLGQLFEKRSGEPRCGYVYPSRTLAEYVARLVEEKSGYWRKRHAAILAQIAAPVASSQSAVPQEPPPLGAVTPEDVEFLRGTGISPDVLPNP